MPRISFQGAAPSPSYSGSRALDASFDRVPKFPFQGSFGWHVRTHGASAALCVGGKLAGLMMRRRNG